MKKNETPVIKIAVVDDHTLFRRGLINLLKSFGSGYEVVIESMNGHELMMALGQQEAPHIIILDVNMPQMNGFETAIQLQIKYPDIHILVITMLEDEATMIKMFKHGAKGYLSKDVEPKELKEAIDTIVLKGLYYADHLTGKLIRALKDPDTKSRPAETLNDKEIKFLELVCSEYTYKEIAEMMCLSIKTVDGYRNTLFEKLEVKSRVGLVLFALKNNLVSLR